jgi:hypothetical protein
MQSYNVFRSAPHLQGHFLFFCLHISLFFWWHICTYYNLRVLSTYFITFNWRLLQFCDLYNISSFHYVAFRVSFRSDPINARCCTLDIVHCLTAARSCQRDADELHPQRYHTFLHTFIPWRDRATTLELIHCASCWCMNLYSVRAGHFTVGK